ncbi:putative RNA-directed DNA polymerase [Helianthus annuus]|nr:putative RNA-directed DNA polymerase [Helianthus annuus]
MTSPKDAMPWVGLYICGASLVCTLAMAADAIQGIRNFWFPCRFFTVNVASVTLIAIAMKLSVDLTTEMPGVYDKTAKYYSIHFLFTMLANFLPSLGLMGDKELLANIIALGLLIITIIVNMLIQSYIGVFPVTCIVAIYLIFPAILPFYIALIVPTSRRIIEHKYKELHELDSTCQTANFASKELVRNVKKHWMMAASEYMQCPKQSHAALSKQILHYLKGTFSYGITYTRGENMLVGYCDSSHNINPDDRRSTTGHVFYFGSSPITWCSQKQSTVALSSCEAEYMAASAAACQAVWLKELIGELLDKKIQAAVLRVDNISAIALTRNPVFHGRSKHIKSRFHYIRECVDREDIVVEHVSGIDRKADILTKALGKIKFKEMTEKLGVEDLSNTSSKFRG